MRRRLLPRLLAGVLVAALGLAACSGSDAPPEGWAPPRPAEDLAGGCPDLRGLYALQAGEGSRFSWAQTPLLGEWRIRPQALEVLSNDRHVLKARWVFSPAQLDAAAIALRERDRPAFDLWQRMQRPDEQARRIAREGGEERYWAQMAAQGPVQFRAKTLRGVEDFLCEDGWLVLLMPTERRDGEALPRPRILIARDASGGLIGRRDEARDSAIPLWAGDAVQSIPLGTQVYRDWARWPVHPPIERWTPNWTVIGGLDERFLLPVVEEEAQPAIGERDAAGRLNPFAVRERPSGLPAPPWQQLSARIGALADGRRSIKAITLESGRLRVEAGTPSNAEAHALAEAIADLPGAGPVVLEAVRPEGEGVAVILSVDIGQD